MDYIQIKKNKSNIFQKSEWEARIRISPLNLEGISKSYESAQSIISEA